MRPLSIVFTAILGLTIGGAHAAEYNYDVPVSVSNEGGGGWDGDFLIPGFAAAGGPPGNLTGVLYSVSGTVAPSLSCDPECTIEGDPVTNNDLISVFSTLQVFGLTASPLEYSITEVANGDSSGFLAAEEWQVNSQPIEGIPPPAGGLGGNVDTGSDFIGVSSDGGEDGTFFLGGIEVTYLYTPTPEPLGMAVFGVGLLGLAATGAGHRRRR